MAERIPQQFIDELLSRIDIVEIIDTRIPLRKAGRDYTARCPFHEEKTPSFTVSQSKQFYHCFGCGAHGTAISFLMEHEGMDFLEAVRGLAARAGMEVPKNALPEPSRHDTLYGLLEQASQFYRQQLRQSMDAVAYLKQRGLTGTVAAEFGIGYAPTGWDSLLKTLGKTGADQEHLLEAGLLAKNEQGGYYDRFRNRIMFPIHDRRGRVMGFGGRVIDALGTPKYLNSPETPLFHKGHELYGLFEAQKSLKRPEKLLVVEGYMDVMALAQHDIRYVVATLGTATTAEHIERLFRATRDVIFCFDGDRAGRNAAWRALETLLPALTEGRQARFLFLPEAEDPDSLIRREGKTAFEQRIGQSVPLSTFLYEGLARQAEISTMEGRARLVELARPLLSKLPAGVLKHMMTAKLAELAQLELSVLLRGLTGKTPRTRTTTQPSKRGPAPPRCSGWSLVERAIGLLLHTPALAALAGDSVRWRPLTLPGIPLLCAVLERAQDRPHISGGALMEYWRDRTEINVLADLARWDPALPEDGLVSEFQGVVQWLDGQLREQRWEQLYAKFQREALSKEEKVEFVELQRLRVAPTV